MQPFLVNVDGIGVEVRSLGPYLARPAKDGDESWAFWYVAGPDGRRNVCSFGRGRVLCDRQLAVRVVAVLAELRAAPLR